MRIVKLIWKIITDSLFPISKIDREILSMEPEQAFVKLTKSPKTPLDKTMAVFAYKDPLVTKLVWNIKYKKSEKALKIGAYALYIEIQKLANNSSNNLTNRIILIPIPSSKRRLNERGFNQTEILADYIKDLDKKDLIIIRKDLLLRQHYQQRQTLKGRKERLENAKSIFSMNKEVPTQLLEQDSHNITVVLDDVITTGSTMQSALGTLTANGFKKVYGLSLAH